LGRFCGNDLSAVCDALLKKTLECESENNVTVVVVKGGTTYKKRFIIVYIIDNLLSLNEFS
jgi:hypothetical protein